MYEKILHGLHSTYLQEYLCRQRSLGLRMLGMLFLLSDFFGGIHAETICILSDKYLLEKSHSRWNRCLCQDLALSVST